MSAVAAHVDDVLPSAPRRLPVGRLVRPLPPGTTSPRRLLVLQRLSVGRLVRQLLPGTLFPQELLVLQHLPLARLLLLLRLEPLLVVVACLCAVQ